jgi:exosome complex RNA-binding protein Rrp4
MIARNPQIKVETISADHNGYVFVQAEVQSRSNPNEYHITKIKIDAETKGLSYSYCNCKGFEFRKRCYHVELLKDFVLNNYKEELEKAKEEKKRLAREALEW